MLNSVSFKYRINQMLELRFTGKISMALNVDWCPLKEDTQEYIDACERQQQFEVSWN